MLFVGIHWPTTFEGGRKHRVVQPVSNDVYDEEQKVRLTSPEAQKFV